MSVNLCLNPENDHVLNTMNEEKKENALRFNKMITLYMKKEENKNLLQDKINAEKSEGRVKKTSQ